MQGDMGRAGDSVELLGSVTYSSSHRAARSAYWPHLRHIIVTQMQLPPTLPPPCRARTAISRQYTAAATLPERAR